MFGARKKASVFSLPIRTTEPRNFDLFKAFRETMYDSHRDLPTDGQALSNLYVVYKLLVGEPMVVLPHKAAKMVVADLDNLDEEIPEITYLQQAAAIARIYSHQRTGERAKTELRNAMVKLMENWVISGVDSAAVVAVDWATMLGKYKSKNYQAAITKAAALSVTKSAADFTDKIRLNGGDEEEEEEEEEEEDEEEDEDGEEDEDEDEDEED